MGLIFFSVSILLLGIALGVVRSRALLRLRDSFTLATAHRHLPELRVLAPVAILATLALLLLFRSYLFTWYLSAEIDRWRDQLLWVLSGGVFSYLTGIALHVAFARRDPERIKLVCASLGIVGALSYIQIVGAWPVAPQLGHLHTPDGYVLQTSGCSCAAASMANVAHVLGVPATEKQMAQLDGTTHAGTSAGQILHALRQIGLRGNKRTATVAALRKIPNPCILLVDYPGTGPDSHAIVILPTTNKTLRIVDPLYGLETRSPDYLALIWRGHLIECRKTDTP